MTKKKTFNNLVKKHYNFLIDEYNFSFKDNLVGNENGIEFKSKKTEIRIIFDWANLVIFFNKYDSSIKKFTLDDFIKENCPHLRIKHPKGCGWTRKNNLENILIHYANIIKKYKEKLLFG